MKVLVIGCGSIGRRHIGTLLSLGCEVIAIDPSDEARLRASAGGPGLRLESAFAVGADVDAAMICTPADTHEAIATDLLEAGYVGPLFCEKPLALKSDARVFREWPHPTTMVGYNWRFHPELALLEDLARRAQTTMFRCYTDIERWPGARYASPLLECSHEIDLSCAWLGDPVHASGTVHDTGALIRLRHPHGDAYVSILWRQPASRSISIVFPGPKDSRTTVRTDVAIDPGAFGMAQSYRDEVLHFVAAARDRSNTVVPFAQGLRVIELCEQVLKDAAA